MINNFVIQYLKEVKQICDSISVEDIIKFSTVIQNTKTTGGRLFFLGVGGSAGNASHAVNDFRKILGIESYSVSDNVSELTARINDDGWDTSYSNWLKISNLSEKDVIIIFSVGGGSDITSKNLVHSIDHANKVGANVLSIVSRNGGYAKENSNVCIMIPVIHPDRITPHAEEWQGIIWHLIVSLLKEKNDKTFTNK
jgi:D-sedoheptulose 7-phosphate isomerase